MVVNYNKLWKLLIDKGITKTEMRRRAGLSTNILAKMGKNKTVSMNTLARITAVMECGLDDIVEINVINDEAMTANNKIKFVDLFAGIGGIRKGFELACAERNLETECVFTSEIKPYAVEVLKQNHPNEEVNGDITQIKSSDIPDFDFLLAGFPCQAFSSAGKRLGFGDTRGILFFEVTRILREKKPFGFVLEKVERLVNHDKAKPNDKIGRTLTIILETLNELNYKVSWSVLNAKNFGIPQDRKRIYIVGTKKEKLDLDNFIKVKSVLSSILESGLPTSQSDSMFECLEDFISAIEETVYQNPKTHNMASTWKRKFLRSYEDFYGIKLNIPRWTDIAHKY